MNNASMPDLDPTIWRSCIIGCITVSAELERKKDEEPLNCDPHINSDPQDIGQEPGACAFRDDMIDG